MSSSGGLKHAPTISSVFVCDIGRRGIKSFLDKRQKTKLCLGCINKEGLEASCNVLLPLEIVFMKRKDLSRESSSVFENKRMLSAPESLIAGKKIV